MGNTVVEMASELTLRSIVLRLAFATLIGALVGVERSSRGRGAGVKTHALVCMGSALVMLTSEYMRVSLHNTGDMARMGAQIISGIGIEHHNRCDSPVVVSFYGNLSCMSVLNHRRDPLNRDFLRQAPKSRIIIVQISICIFFVYR